MWLDPWDNTFVVFIYCALFSSLSLPTGFSSFFSSTFSVVTVGSSFLVFFCLLKSEFKLLMPFFFPFDFLVGEVDFSSTESWEAGS